MGGRTGPAGRAASGLFYQYLFTIEKFLALVSAGSPMNTQVRIEDPEDPNVLDPDIVDFSVYSGDGLISEIHQAKSVAAPKSSTISAGQALVTLVRMTARIESPMYVLTTNARAGDDIDRLNELLASKCADAEMLQELQFIVRHNTAASKALLTVGMGAHLARLRRAHVNATGEPSFVIRSRIVAELQKWRSQNRLTLGDRAAWILESRLIADVFTRAAGTTVESEVIPGRNCRCVPLTEFTALLAEPSEVLAQVTARWEAGRGAERVPSGDGIPRAGELETIVECFSNIRSRRVLRCVMTGPSGVGKTRTAAMYVRNEADSYDRVCWIDAESDASIISSIMRQHRTIGIPDALAGGDSARIVEAFTECVSSFIGRWLIVFDNVHSSRQLDHWVPVRGNAHVLVTSTNAMNWTEYQSIAVGDMDRDQARELLRSRLIDDVPQSTTEESGRVNEALDRVAVKLGRRPLLLHIAASHFGTLAALVSGVEIYTGRIDALAELMGEDSYDRGRYPRTYQAAIQLCLERLIGDRSDPAAVVAERMLSASSFLASQNVPAFLLFASATRTPDTLIEGLDPWSQLHEQLPTMNAAIGRIRTQSLMDRRDDLSADTPWEFSVQLDINEIVQYVIRRTLKGAPTVLDNTAAHLSAWLAKYLDHQQFDSALAIQTHVLQLLSLAKDCSDRLTLCPVLAGNEANFLMVQGRPHEARQWLRFEMDHLKRRSSPHFKTMAKTADQIVQVQLHLGEPVAQIISDIKAVIRFLQAAIDEGDVQWDGDRICVNLMAGIGNLTGRAKADQKTVEELGALRRQVESLFSHFPDGGAAERHANILAVEHALSGQDYQRALTDAADLLAGLDPNDHVRRLDLKNLRVEALCNLDDIDRLEIELADFLQDLERNRAVVNGVWHNLIHTAHRLAVRIALAVGETVRLREIFKKIVRTSGTLRTNDYEHYSHALLAGCEASQNQDRYGVKLLLDLAADKRPSDKTIGEGLGIAECWLQYWMQCAEKGFTARALAAAVLDRRLGVSQSGDPQLRLDVLAPALNGELSDAVNNGGHHLLARQRIDVGGRTRGFEIDDSTTERPLGYLLFGDVVERDSLGQPDRQFGVRGQDGTVILPTHLLLKTFGSLNNDGVLIAIR